MHPDPDKYILELKTVQSGNIKILFEVLKEVLNGDINIVFTPEYIKIVEVDKLKTAIVYLQLNSKAFEYYNCTKNHIVVGVNTNNIYKIIKIAKSNADTISFFIESSKEYILGIRMENSEDNKAFEVKLPLLDKDYVNLNIPNVEFESIISLSSIKFQKYIKDLNSLATNRDGILDITSIGQQLKMKCLGDFSENKAIFGMTSNDTQINNKTNDIVQGKFSLKYLLLFTKATSLCKTVQIYLKNDYSIILEYNVGSLGSLRFILSPIQ